MATLEAHGGQIVLSIKDNGAGVPESIWSKLFDPFVSEGKQKGTGLGLTLAQRIAEEHGGAVRLLSSSPGETVFQMRLVQFNPVPRVQVLTDQDKVVTG